MGNWKPIDVVCIQRMLALTVLQPIWPLKSQWFTPKSVKRNVMLSILSPGWIKMKLPNPWMIVNKVYSGFKVGIRRIGALYNGISPEYRLPEKTLQVFCGSNAAWPRWAFRKSDYGTFFSSRPTLAGIWGLNFSITSCTDECWHTDLNWSEALLTVTPANSF